MCLLNICARVIIPISFQKVDRAPYAESRAQGDNEGLEGADRTGEKYHVLDWNRTFLIVVFLSFSVRKYGTGKQYARNFVVPSGIAGSSSFLNLLFLVI